MTESLNPPITIKNKRLINAFFSKKPEYVLYDRGTGATTDVMISSVLRAISSKTSILIFTKHQYNKKELCTKFEDYIGKYYGKLFCEKKRNDFYELLNGSDIRVLTESENIRGFHHDLIVIDNCNPELPLRGEQIIKIVGTELKDL